MSPLTVLIIRHAEKPGLDEGGVTEAGEIDDKSITPRGWVRVGIWMEMMAPSLGCQPALPSPDHLFAYSPSSNGDKRKESGPRHVRPAATITPLARKLGRKIDDRFGKDDEPALADVIKSLHGTALVCWRHERIPAICHALAPGLQVPEAWPDTCYNVVFKLTRTGSSAWSFEQLVAVMLQGDSGDKI